MPNNTGVDYRSFPTPNQTDVIFYEYRIHSHSDVRRFEKGKLKYCDKHPDSKNYPDHVLVFVSDEDEQRGRRFYYYAQPEDQYKYNHSFVKNLGGTLDTYQREYVIKREDHVVFREALTYCDADPETAENDTTTYPASEGYQFRGVRVSRISKELDSCFVLVTRTFSKVPVEKTFPTPLEVDVVFSETHPVCYADTKAYGSVHPDTATYPDHKLVYKAGVDPTGLVKMWYAADYQTQYLHNYQYTGVNAAGGNRYKSYSRVYFVRRENWTPDALAAGDADPDPTKADNTTKFPKDEYVFTGEQERDTGQRELDSCYVLAIRTFSKLCPLESTRWDNELEEYVTSTTTVLPSADFTAPTAIGTDGIVTESRQINCDWTVTTTDKVLDEGKTITIWTYENYPLPAVLDSIELMEWQRLDGRSFRNFRPIYKRRAQRKPTLIKIERTFHTSLQDLSALTGADKPLSLQPNSINYASPFFNISIPPCLHGDETFIADIGTNDPVYQQTVGSSRTFAATTLSDGTTPAIDWPTELLVDVGQRKYKAGFVVDRKTIYPLA